MAQSDVWENEYNKNLLVTGKAEPQRDILRFLKFLKKAEKKEISGWQILDLGSGTGRNTNFLASLDNRAVGLEISDTALKLAKTRALEAKLNTEFLKHNIGSPYPFADEEFDLILDVVSSNSLNEKERANYLNESHRVLKKNGYFFAKALCKDGDKNALNLLKKYPGLEKDTYKIPELGLTERVFSKEDFVTLYEQYFKIIKLDKKTNYSKFKGTPYKRNYWLAYLKKVSK